MGKETNINRRNRIRNLKYNYLEAYGCLECGSKSNLTFHHVDPKTKKFDIGGKSSISIKDFFEEAEKCVILCNSCHFNHHERDRLRNIYIKRK